MWLLSYVKSPSEMIWNFGIQLHVKLKQHICKDKYYEKIYEYDLFGFIPL